MTELAFVPRLSVTRSQAQLHSKTLDSSFSFLIFALPALPFFSMCCLGLPIFAHSTLPLSLHTDLMPSHQQLPSLPRGSPGFQPFNLCPQQTGCLGIGVHPSSEQPPGNSDLGVICTPQLPVPCVNLKSAQSHHADCAVPA